MPDFSGLVDKRIRKALSGIRLAFRGVLTRITHHGGRTDRAGGRTGP